MRTEYATMNKIQDFLEQKRSELVQSLRRPDGIAIEKSPEAMDETQYALDRELAILNVDRESSLLREVNEALDRMQDGNFGTCIECEESINPKRLAAVPWASRCIHCQEAYDRVAQEWAE